MNSFDRLSKYFWTMSLLPVYWKLSASSNDSLHSSQTSNETFSLRNMSLTEFSLLFRPFAAHMCLWELTVGQRVLLLCVSLHPSCHMSQMMDFEKKNQILKTWEYVLVLIMCMYESDSLPENSNRPRHSPDLTGSAVYNVLSLRNLFHLAQKGNYVYI